MKAVLFLMLLTTTALADSTATEAKHAYQLGARFYAAEKFSAAAQAFLEAYRLQPNPMILFNVAQAYRKDGRFPEALDHYQRFLQETQPAQRGSVDAEARRYVDELRAHLGAQQALLDRRPPEHLTAPPEPVHLTPPPVAVVAPAAVIDTTPEPPPPPVYRRWYLWTPLAVVVVAVGLGVGLGVGLRQPDPALGPITPTYTMPIK